ncbi:hypothetical protein Ddc_02105 [Ditylenchus destructor]|nr:hypothetical protein Ddc_02105 [Ditylenchus destructor]
MEDQMSRLSFYNLQISLLCLILPLSLLWPPISSGSPPRLARFQLESVSAHSIVVKMTITSSDGNTESAASPFKPHEGTKEDTTTVIPLRRSAKKLEMKISIFDLERLREFRRSELTAALDDDPHSSPPQLFSFDGLLSNTWFAIRIDYRLLYYETPNAQGNGGGFQDFPTKQELIVRTKNDTSLASPQSQQPSYELVGGHEGNYPWSSASVPTEEESVIRFEHIHSTPAFLNVTISTVFPNNPKLSTLVVPELRCLRGTIKPPAQKITDKGVISFDLQKVSSTASSHSHNHVRAFPGDNQFHGNEKPRRRHNCFQLCIFPFIRADISGGHGLQTFRAKEFCDTLDVARRLTHHLSDGETRQHKLRSNAARHLAGNAGEDNSPSWDDTSATVHNFYNLSLISTLCVYSLLVMKLFL